MKILQHINITDSTLFAPDILAQNTDISKQKIKQAMQKGAVWLTQNNSTKRIRRVKTKLSVGAILHFYYDEYILQQTPLPPTIIKDLKNYSVWHKPSGVLSQGSKFADHCAINRWIEVNFRQPVFLIHRLDKETSGLMLFAHNKKTAQALSSLFKHRMLHKFYIAGVVGNISYQLPLQINKTLDGKHAKTTIIKSWQENNITWLWIKIDTGRKHQIRQHLASLGLFIIGDKLYGNSANMTNNRMLLQAERLTFTCPVKMKSVCYQTPISLINQQI